MKPLSIKPPRLLGVLIGCVALLVSCGGSTLETNKADFADTVVEEANATGWDCRPETLNESDRGALVQYMEPSSGILQDQIPDAVEAIDKITTCTQSTDLSLYLLENDKALVESTDVDMNAVTTLMIVKLNKSTYTGALAASFRDDHACAARGFGSYWFAVAETTLPTIIPNSDMTIEGKILTKNMDEIDAKIPVDNCA